MCDQIGTPQLLLNQSQEVVWGGRSQGSGEET
ncbi:hypothetical protein [Pelistega indica]|nr:hypothetical protein [Pelistega indica]